MLSNNQMQKKNRKKNTSSYTQNTHTHQAKHPRLNSLNRIKTIQLNPPGPH